MSVFVITDADGEYVQTVLGMEGVPLPDGWASHEMPCAAGPGQAWHKATSAWADDADEQARHEKAQLPVVSNPLLEIEELKARITVLEAALPQGGAG